MKRLSFIIFIFFFIVYIAKSQEIPKQETKPILPAKEFVTNHSGTFGGKTIKYKAVAGEMFLTNHDGDTTASIWSVSYITETSPTDVRPVIFIFNGGPGSASVWLHMGLFGPQITKVHSDAKQDDGAAPYPLVNNPVGLLDLADLVFIDPVGTGYSRVVGKGRVEDYWGLNEDATSIARFMRLWVTKYKRWNAPKYIAGESFGTTRAVAVTEKLEDDGQEMSLNGLILISQALDYQGSTSENDNIVSFVTYFPSMAATAWYHKKAGQGKTIEAFIDEARKFVLDEYVSILYKGSSISMAEKNQITERIAYFTGLSKNYIELSGQAILIPRFRKELLRENGITIGQLDGRYMGNEADQVDDKPTLGDASGYNISGAYTAALNHYFSSILHIDMDRPYKTSNNEIGHKWRWRDAPDNSYWEPKYVNVARKLGNSMRANKDLKVLVASGYYDLICPFFDAEYTFSRNGIVPERVQYTYYESGHMMYVHEPSLLKLAKDIRAFLNAAK